MLLLLFLTLIMIMNMLLLLLFANILIFIYYLKHSTSRECIYERNLCCILRTQYILTSIDSDQLEQ